LAGISPVAPAETMFPATPGTIRLSLSSPFAGVPCWKLTLQQKYEFINIDDEFSFYALRTTISKN